MNGFSVFGYLQTFADFCGEKFPDMRIVCGIEPTPSEALRKTIFPCLYVYISGYTWSASKNLNLSLSCVFGRRAVQTVRNRESEDDAHAAAYCAVGIDAERLIGEIIKARYLVGGLRILSGSVEIPQTQPRPVFFSAARFEVQAPALRPLVDAEDEIITAQLEAEKYI